jgi:hypothetical protein
MNGHVNEPGDEHEFHIFLQSCARSTRAGASPNPFFGWETQRQSTYSPSNLGLALLDEQTNYPYGEVVGKSLYLFPKVHDTTDKLPILAAILEKCAPELDLDSALEEVLASIPTEGLTAAAGRRVTQFGFRAYRRETATRLIKEILLPALGENACLRDCDGSVQKKADDGSFHVLYNARPAAFAREAALPTGRGVPIMTGEGELAGELLDKNLYIYSDLLGYGRRTELKRFADVLLTARRQVIVERSLTGVLLVGDQFVDECLREARVEASADPSVAESQFKTVNEKLETTLTAVRNAERETLRLIAFPEEALGREYDNLVKLKKVRDVRVTNSEVIVTTDMLYCVHPNTGVVYKIGEFKIHIPMTATRDLKFMNQTHTIQTSHGSMHAPHVGSGGIACLGSTKDQFPELIRNQQFAAAAQLAILFLESVNPTDPWGKQIGNWPVERGRLSAVADLIRGA